MNRLRTLRIGYVVGIGFGLVLFLALLIGALGRVAYDFSRWQSNVIQTRGDVERLTLQLEIISIQRTDALRRYLREDNVNFLATYQTKQSAYGDVYSRLAPLLNTPEERGALEIVSQTEAAFNEKAREIIELYNDGFPAAALFLWDREGVDAQSALLTSIEELRQVQGDTSTEIIREAGRTENLVIVAISISIPLLLIIGIISSLFITRSITRPVSQLVNTINSLRSDLKSRVQPAGPQEIDFLGRAINEMAHGLYESRQSLEEYKERTERELLLASQIQASLLPDRLPKVTGLDMAIFWKSAREVGGDFYAYVNLNDGVQGLAIGDVSGKGAPAAMAGALSVGLLEAYAPNYARPELLLSELNQDLCTRLASQHMNVACCYAIIDLAGKCLRVANAGCIYPYLRRDHSLHEIAARGLPLGAWGDFDYTAQQIPLSPGDLLIFCSDGLVEAQDAQGEMFGFERYQAELMKLPASITAQAAVDQLVAVARAFTNFDNLHDDITILAVRII